MGDCVLNNLQCRGIFTIELTCRHGVAWLVRALKSLQIQRAELLEFSHIAPRQRLLLESSPVLVQTGAARRWRRTPRLKRTYSFGDVASLTIRSDRLGKGRPRSTACQTSSRRCNLAAVTRARSLPVSRGKIPLRDRHNHRTRRPNKGGRLTPAGWHGDNPRS